MESENFYYSLDGLVPSIRRKKRTKGRIYAVDFCQGEDYLRFDPTLDGFGLGLVNIWAILENILPEHVPHRLSFLESHEPLEIRQLSQFRIGSIKRRHLIESDEILEIYGLVLRLKDHTNYRQTITKF